MSKHFRSSCLLDHVINHQTKAGYELDGGNSLSGLEEDTGTN